MPFFLRLLLLIPVLACSWSRASETLSVRLEGDDQGFSSQVLSKVDALLRRVEPDVTFWSDSDRAAGSSKRLLIAIGSKGARIADSAGAETAVLAVLPPRQTAEAYSVGAGRLVSMIQGDMPVGRVFNFVQLMAGKKNGNVALIAGPATQNRLARIEAAAGDRNIRLHVEKVERETDVGPAVERSVQHAAWLLALPDAVAHSAGTVPPLLLISYRAGVPVLGYSESYLRAGAMAALYATPDQIAQQVLESVQAYRQGKGLPTVQYLKYFTVGVNVPVARSLGMQLPQVEEMEARLRQMKE